MSDNKIVAKLKETLENPALFNLLQFVISGKQNKTRRLIREGLKLKAGEPLLDVCCGTGEFANVALGPYLGIDLNPRYIEYAQKKYGVGAGHAERKFLAQDISNVEFKPEEGTYPKAMMINSMHHLDDAQNEAVLAGIARLTRDRFVIVDMDPTPTLGISRFLAKQDRGNFIRPLAEQVALAGKFFIVEKATTYYSGLCGQTLIVCRTR